MKFPPPQVLPHRAKKIQEAAVSRMIARTFPCGFLARGSRTVSSDPPPPNTPSHRMDTPNPGKGGAKKGDTAAAGGGSGAGGGGGGLAGSRRANVSELKGLVEVRASSQAARGGVAAVTGEGRPLLRVG